MINPSISVIVCCYNGKDTIVDCLNSLLSQILEGITFEVIIVDDGSKDGTAEKIKSFLKKETITKNPTFRYYRKVNEGLSIARNFGASKARSQLVSYIDEDAVADKHFVNNLVATFRNNPEVNCVGGRIELLNDKNEIASLIQNSIFSLYMKSDSSIIGTNMAFRISFLNKMGGFQPEFTYRGDETAFFAKAERELNKLKTHSVIVKHKQPETLKKWFRVRYENGYFKAAIDQMANNNKAQIRRQNFISLFGFIFPVFVLMLYLLKLSSLVVIIGTILYFVAFIKRFILNRYIADVVREYKRNVKAVKPNKLAIIVYMTIVGRYIADYGYLNGYVRYRKQTWQKTTQIN